MSFPILSVTLFAPLAGALLIMVISQENVKAIRRVGIAFAFLALILTDVIWVGVAQPGADEMQYSERYSWIPAFSIWYNLGVDGLSAPMLFLSALLVTLSLFYSARTIETQVKEYYFLFLLLEMGMFGVFLCLDMDGGLHGFLGLLRRLCHQGALLSLPHLATGCPQRSADGWQRHLGGHFAEIGGLWADPHRTTPLS